MSLSPRASLAKDVLGCQSVATNRHPNDDGPSLSHGWSVDNTGKVNIVWTSSERFKAVEDVLASPLTVHAKLAV